MVQVLGYMFESEVCLFKWNIFKEYCYSLVTVLKNTVRMDSPYLPNSGWPLIPLKWPNISRPIWENLIYCKKKSVNHMEQWCHRMNLHDFLKCQINNCSNLSQYAEVKVINHIKDSHSIKGHTLGVQNHHSLKSY